MILFGSALSDGNKHDPHKLPMVLGGRGGGRIATGQHWCTPSIRRWRISTCPCWTLSGRRWSVLRTAPAACRACSREVATTHPVSPYRSHHRPDVRATVLREDGCARSSQSRMPSMSQPRRSRIWNTSAVPRSRCFRSRVGPFRAVVASGRRPLRSREIAPVIEADQAHPSRRRFANQAGQP